MLTFLGIILFLQVLFCESKILWKAYIPKSVTEPSISFYSGKLVVPSDYESRESSPKLTLHIRKMCNSPSPIWNIIALSGGPGINSKEYINKISNISEALNNIPSCLYAIDHRGVGKSKPKLIEEADSKNWIEKIDSIINNPNFPIKTLTITNAAMDVLELAKYLKENSNSNIKLGLIGSSYGSMLAHRTIFIHPNIFNVCIFDGYSVFEDDSPNADEGLIFECKNNDNCRDKLGPHPERIRLVPSYLVDRNLNKCTGILHEFLDNKSNLKRLRKKEQLQTFFSIIPSRKFNHYRALLAMIHHTWTCPDPEIYKEALIKFDDFISRKKKKNSTSLPSTIEDNKDNEFVFDYLTFSEIDRIYHEQDGFDNCSRRDYPIGLINRCQFWKDNKRKYNRMKPFLYTPDYLKPCLIMENGEKRHLERIDKCKFPLIDTRKTKIYLIHGRMDFITPIEPALREFDRIKASMGKRKLIFDYEEHCPAFENSCKHKIMNEIFNNGPEDETDDCIRQDNESSRMPELEEIDENLEILWATDGEDLKLLPKQPCDTNTCFNK